MTGTLRRLSVLALLAGGPALAQPRGGVEETTDRPATVDVAASPSLDGPDSEAWGAEFVMRGVGARKTVRWSVSPRYPGMLVRPFPSGAPRFIFAGPPGEYQVTAEVVSRTVGKLTKPLSEYKEGDDFPMVETSASYTKTIVLTGGVPVPPGPGPTPPGPTPPVPPAPVPPAPVPPAPEPNPMPGVQGLHMLVVYESADLSAYPAAQVTSWQSKAVFDYLAAKGASKNWRVWDKDVPNLARAEPKWQAAMARAKGKPLPWVIVSNGASGYEGPAPANVNELLALLKKYGGD